MGIRIVRAIWGDGDGTNPLIKRRFKINDDIKQVAISAPHDYTTICFGNDNYQQIVDSNIPALKISTTPYTFHPTEEIYRHKIEAIKFALEYFKEPILYLDWDCLPKKEFNLSFKNQFAANLECYNLPKCWWRTINQRYVPNGGFVYIQDLEVITKIIEAWDIIKASGNPCNNDEVAYALYLDKLHGSWIGDSAYANLYEPTGICSLNKKGIWINTNAMFIHYLGNTPRRFRW